MAAESPKPLGRGAYLYTDGDTQRVGWAVRDGQAPWVFVEGRAYRVDERSRSLPGNRPSTHAEDALRIVEGRNPGAARSRSSASSDEAALAAPMPATVTAVNVAVGQTVAKGDVLLTLEAMKMEMPVRAPRDGVVRRIGCGVGDLVQPGVPLVDLSPSA
jgi:biotin carboxyl carrier protein